MLIAGPPQQGVCRCVAGCGAWQRSQRRCGRVASWAARAAAKARFGRVRRCDTPDATEIRYAVLNHSEYRNIIIFRLKYHLLLCHACQWAQSCRVQNVLSGSLGISEIAVCDGHLC
jgi:hypothetical protein